MPPFQPANSFWCQNAMKGKDQNGKRQDPQRLKTRSQCRPPKKNAWFGEGKKNRGKDAVEFEARWFRSYPNWLSISARLSTKPCYRLIFLKKNAVCLSIKAKNELRLLFQEIRHTSQIFPHLFHERFIRPLFARLAVKWLRSYSILPHPSSICPISNHSLSISRNTLVGFSPIPKPTSIPSADFPFTQNPWQSSVRQETMHGGDLDPFWIAANPASEMLPKRAPTIKPQKQAYLGKTGGGQGIWMQYVSVSLKIPTVITFNIHETSVITLVSWVHHP